MAERRKKNSAKLVWDNKPKRAPNPKDIEFQTAEVVIPNPTNSGQYHLPLFNQPVAGLTSLFPAQMGELPLGSQEIDKLKMNRLIWGDNLLAMQALLTQGYAGKIDLIYIDPPFLSSADYNFQMTVEGKEVTKEASIIERLAYTDTWEGGLDSFLDMIYPRLQLMKRLLSEKGSIYIHCDYNVNSYLRILGEEIFGRDNFINEVIWKRKGGSANPSNKMGVVTDTIFIFAKSIDSICFQTQFTKDSKEAKKYIKERFKNRDENGRLYLKSPIVSPNPRPNLTYEYKGYKPPKNGWSISEKMMEQWDKEGKLYFPASKKEKIYRKIYLDEYQGQPIQNLWTDISVINPVALERLDYPTQKPEALLERIIKASSNEGDLVADFFCGSGTTMAVAERLGRRWIGCNLDKVGLQVSRNRLVEQQSSPFLLENIGNYQRHMIYLSGSKIGEMQRIILKLYGAEPRTDRIDLGIRSPEDGPTELVYVGYPDRPTTAKKVIELAKDAEILDGTGYKTLIILAWDYDYNFSTDLENQLKTRQVKTEIKPLTIPPEIYNYLKKAKNEDDLEDLREKLVFHEKPYLKVSHTIKNPVEGDVTIALKIERYVLMNFPVPEKQQAELRKIIKDNFAALIDYWAVDWNYDGQLFKSQWQAIRGNGKSASTVVTEITSPIFHSPQRTIAVRLVDIFGNDASAIIEVK